MSGVPVPALLAAWESALAQGPLQRALTLLAAAMPERTREQWAQVPIGERDRQLLALRASLFGNRIDALGACPACAEQLEVSFETSQVSVPAVASSGPVQVEVDGYLVACRLPDSADLLVAGAAPAGQARAVLLERCIASAVRRSANDVNMDEPVAAAALPAAVSTAVERALQEADPQADVSLALVCPACRHAWTLDFDVLAYLWSEIDDWAARTLREVHDLASAYGWSEAAILEMPAARRRWYRELVAGQRG